MASTNKTQNLELNQWVRTDPVLMDDFNADNQKIDVAIAAASQAAGAALEANPWVKLFDVTATADVGQVDLNLSGIDLSKYYAMRIYFASAKRDNGIGIRLNNLYTSIYACFPGNYAGDGFANRTLVSDYGCWAEVSLCTQSTHIWCAHYHWMVQSLSPTDVTTVSVLGSSFGYIPVGSRVLAMGVRI